VLAALLEVDADLVRERPEPLRISDKGFASKAFERLLPAQGITLLRPSRKREVMRPWEPMLTMVRQLTSLAPGRQMISRNTRSHSPAEIRWSRMARCESGTRWTVTFCVDDTSSMDARYREVPQLMEGIAARIVSDWPL
jgi:hypothetical protein